ncbi:MAG: hypothetical protein H7123_07045 [Thermoleophilia bacterium]|nr:hypothetical protein [Thermoleophilia bacterium]
MTAPVPPAAPGAFSSLNLQWENRGLFQHNWTTTVNTNTRTGAPAVSVDSNLLFSKAHTNVDGDRFEQAAAREYASVVAERSAALLGSLTSNLTAAQYANNKVKPGEFSIALTGTGTPLFYTGLLKTAPQPLLDLIDGAHLLRSHT